MTSYILIDKDHAKVGERFYYYRDIKCDECIYRNICTQNKIEGLLYEIIKVKKPNTKTICMITEREAYLATVKPAPIKIAIPTNDAVVSAEIFYAPLRCGELHCPYITYCNKGSNNLKNGRILIKILRRIEDIDCPYSLKLTLVEAELIHVFP